MVRVDFAFGADHRLRMACRVARKQYLAGRRIVVYTKDLARLHRYDQLLWGFEATAFVPHVMADDPLAPTTPVLLTADSPALALGSGSDPVWLLNLDLECPPDMEAFERVLEIVSDHEEDKLAARQRWRAYQAAGHDVRAHDVSGR